MRIASGSILFVLGLYRMDYVNTALECNRFREGFVNLAGGRIGAEEVEPEVAGVPEWWSARITKIDREERETIGLASEDNERSPHGWEEETGDVRRGPFASSSEGPETRPGESPFESRRENFGDERADRRLFDSEAHRPSPVLLPPHEASSPAYLEDAFGNDLAQPWGNESSSHAGKSGSESERTRNNEVTKLHYKNDAPVQSDDDSSGAENDDRWMEFVRESSVNFTKSSGRKSDGEAEPGLPRSFYIDEELGNERPESSTAASGRTNRPKNGRGSVKYTDDRFESVKTFMRKGTFSSAGRYDRQRRPKQRSNHFRFSDDPNRKTGAVPGVPGRDYPVHQEHTHHHLRNVVDRFPCPRAAKTHVYLADRASRCQIFYVCYGTNTGVPMVCPNGTLFSEPLQVCDWWFNVSC